MSDEMAAASKSTLESVVGLVKVPGEFEARVIEEGLRKETIGVYGIGDKKRMAYCETIWPEWIADKRQQVRREILGEESNASNQAEAGRR